MKHVSTRKLISLALTALMLVSGMTIMTRIPAVAEEKTVVITLDPGHGPQKTGTNGAVEYGGINEHFYTYSMATYAKERLEQLVAERGGQEDVIFVGRVSEAEANRYVHFADCAYLSFQDNPLFHMTIPAKLQTYLACGTPVLAAAGGETAQLITSSGCGIVAEQECAALAAAAREAAAMSKEQRSEMAAAARKYYDGNFVMDTLVEELLELMENETKKQE